MFAAIALLSPVAVGQAEAASKRLRVAQLAPDLQAAASGRNVISMRVRTESGATCTGLVSVKRARQTLLALKADKQGKVAWRWLVPAMAPSGKWTLTTRCKSGTRSGSANQIFLLITQGKTSSGNLVEPSSLAPIEGQPAGRGGGEQCGPFTDLSKTWCTCRAYQKRQDVYDTAVFRGVPRGGPRASGSLYSVWDAQQWLVNARRAGIPTGSRPAKGALVVWGVPDSAAWGHIGFVEDATSDTNVLINECNFDNRGSCRTTWRNPTVATSPLQGYIYGGPVQTPSSPPVGNPEISGAPSATSWAPGRLDVFALGSNNRLQQWWYNTDGWNGPAEPSGGQSFGSTPTVTSWGPNRLDVFARGPAGDLIHGSYDGAWHQWESLSDNAIIRG